MSTMPSPPGMRPYAILCLFLFLTFGTVACAQGVDVPPEPAVYLNFDEGSGTIALDGSGHGNAGTLFNTSRIASGGCSRALSFANPDSYVAIPFRALNHPTREITVSAWFYVDTITPAALVSAYADGGYRLGFDDGNDLWWTLNLGQGGDVSVAVLHENFAPGQWHQVTGTYDGNTMKIFLDGVLRNQANASGPIHYEKDNYVILGADAGPAETPLECSPHFTGGLDEVRIYPVALTYGQVMDDRFRCSGGERIPPVNLPAASSIATCEPVSGSVRLGANETAVRVLSFADRDVNGTWRVTVPPGSMLRVQAFDAYMKAAPDAWYLEIAENGGRPARTVAFPGRNNAPAEAILPSGNATVTVRYFSGGERFPAVVALQLESLKTANIRPPEPNNILENPIIVIYSASWVTLVAILLVMIWLHRRKRRLNPDAGPECPVTEEKKL